MSSNLNLDQVLDGQSAKEATINDATGQLDAALTEFKSVSFASGGVTLSTTDYERNVLFKLTSATADQALTLPAQKKLAAFVNASGHTITLTVGSTTIALADTDSLIAYTDGTTNGLLGIGASSGSGSGATVTNPTINDQTGTTYTLVLADENNIVRSNNASAQTITVPPNSSVAFDIGSSIVIMEKGAGQITIAAGAGVTINSPAGLKISAQFGQAVLTKTDTDTWYLAGSTTT